MNEKIIYYIPAKKNSVRCKGKNFRQLGDKLLIDWSVDFALKLQQELGGIVVVDTDNQEYVRDYCMMHYSKQDTGTNKKQIQGFVEKYKQYKDYLFVLLQPTSPFRDFDNVKKAIKFNGKENVNIVFTIPIKNPCKIVQIIKNKMDITCYWKKQIFMETGACFICKLAKLDKKWDYISGDKSFLPFEDKGIMIDIDTEQDFKIAEFLLSQMEDKTKC